MPKIKPKPYKIGDKLTVKQQRWIDEYIKTDDYGQATINAGYHVKEPRLMGYQNSIKFKELISNRKKEIRERISNENIAELSEIFEFWTTVFSNDNNKMADRIKASELLAKAKGGFIEKVEVKTIDTDWFKEDD